MFDKILSKNNLIATLVSSDQMKFFNRTSLHFSDLMNEASLQTVVDPSLTLTLGADRQLRQCSAVVLLLATSLT